MVAPSVQKPEAIKASVRPSRAISARKTTAPSAKPATGVFDASTITEGLEAWGTECNVKLPKIKYVDAPAPVKPYWVKPDVGKLPEPVAATVKKEVETPKPARSASAERRHQICMRSRAAREAREKERRAKTSGFNYEVAEVLPKSAKPITAKPLPKKSVEQKRCGISGKYLPQKRTVVRHIEPVHMPTPLKEKIKAALVKPVAKGLLLVDVGDITQKGGHYPIAHCASSDWNNPGRMSKGVAKVLVDNILHAKPSPNDLVYDRLAKQEVDDYTVYTLLTKSNYYDKPNTSSVSGALRQLSIALRKAGLTTIRMPCICTGLDRMSPYQVAPMLQKYLLDSGITVILTDKDEEMLNTFYQVLVGVPSSSKDESVWGPDSISSWATKLKSDLRDFIEKPKSVIEKPKRVIGGVKANNDLVGMSFACKTDHSGSFELMYADFRHATRTQVPVAVASSMDWGHARRGDSPPLSYLYKEQGYPKPERDDLINSRLAFQDIEGKKIYTLFVKQSWNAYPKLINLRHALNELADALVMTGVKQVDIPAICMNRDRLSYEDVLNSILELVCQRGISVRMCTKSKAQYYSSLKVLRSHSLAVQGHAIDDSTPENWEPVEGQCHNHVCYSCGLMYSHWHKFFNLDHPQFDRQCPNKECKEYHRGKNYTNSQLITLASSAPDTKLAEKRLADPNWIREASAFPAAIETAFEAVTSLARGLNDHLFPTQLPEVPRDDVIALRKIGYAGAVDAKPKPVRTYVASAFHGLGELKPRPKKVKPVVLTAKDRKNFATSEQRPIKPSFCRNWSKNFLFEWLAIGGWDGEYEGTYYRVGGTRHQHKKSARKAKEFLLFGWHKNAALSSWLAVDECHEDDIDYSHHVEEETSVPRKVKTPKVITDDEWMAYFRKQDNNLCAEITYEKARKQIKKTRLRTVHQNPKLEAKVFDISGDVASLAPITNTVRVVDNKTRKSHKFTVNPEYNLMDCVSTLRGTHQVTTARTFTCSTRLTSGSGIFNADGVISSIITVSNGKGQYAIVTPNCPVQNMPCSGVDCVLCDAASSLEFHNPPKGGQKKKKNGKPKTKTNNKPTTNKQVRAPQPPNSWKSPAAVASHTADLVSLKFRAERQAQELKELEDRVRKMKVDSQQTLASASRIVRSAGNVLSAPTLNKPQPKKKVAKKKGSYNLLPSIGLVLMFFLPLALGTPTPDPYVTKVNEVKSQLEALTNWFSSNKENIKNYRAALTELAAIKKTLESFAKARDDNVLDRVIGLQTAYEETLRRLEGRESAIVTLKETVNDLQKRLNELQSRVDELEKSAKETKKNFEDFKTRFTRSTELTEVGNLEEMDEGELNATYKNLKSAESEFTDLLKAESAFAASEETSIEKGQDDRAAKAQTARQTATTEAPKSVGPTKVDIPMAPNGNTYAGSNPGAIWCLGHLTEPPKINASLLRLSLGASGFACDDKEVSFCLYEGWQQCSTKVKAQQVIGMAYGRCSIGKSNLDDNYIIVQKDDTTKDRFACSASCFHLDHIVMAIKANMPNPVCVWPLIYSAHWDVNPVLSRMSEISPELKTLVILRKKMIITISNGEKFELPLVSKDTLSICCQGYLADSLGEKLSYIDGVCLCKASGKAIERAIKEALIEKYVDWSKKYTAIVSLKTIASAVVIGSSFFINPFLGIVTSIGIFAYNANADCALKNYHTLYVGDSSSKQIYTTMYMQVGDCFTLGENTFELTNIDDSYLYRWTSTYPTDFSVLCTDIDWGCGLAEGSKICSDFNKDCKGQCDQASGAFYRKHCLHTTTFHNDGCFGFLVQDHSVSVHGGVCLSTNKVNPYKGYNRVEGTESRKFTFKITAFDQSREIVVDSKQSIYQENDFTIQDIVINRDRLPHEVIDAGELLCSFTDLSGNDFCRSVNGNPAQLTNQGCVNLDWTFLGDEAKWQIEDTSALITPYLRTLFEPCDMEKIGKVGDNLNVTPSGLEIVFKIDSDHRSTAFTVNRCENGTTLIEFRSSPGYVQTVQHTFVTLTAKHTKECYISMRLDACSFISNNYCKVGTTETLCRWAIYCPAVMDIRATIVGASDLATYNLTSGKFSAPTIEYSKSYYSVVTSGAVGLATTIGSGLTKAVNWIPGYQSVVNMLNASMQKVLIPICLFGALYVCFITGSMEGMVLTAVFAWIYFFTGFVHAIDEDSAEFEEDSYIKVWHLIAMMMFSFVDWCAVIRISYTTVCRRVNGVWCRMGFNNIVIGIPFLDWVIYFVGLVCLGPNAIYLIISSSMYKVVEVVKNLIAKPQSDLYNTEELNHSPIAAVVCSYLSRSGNKITTNIKVPIHKEIIYQCNRSALHHIRTNFASEIGYHMFNSPPDDSEYEECEVTELNISEDPNEQPREDKPSALDMLTPEQKAHNERAYALIAARDAEQEAKKPIPDWNDMVDQASPHPIFEREYPHPVEQQAEKYAEVGSENLSFVVSPIMVEEPEIVNDEVAEEEDSEVVAPTPHNSPAKNASRRGEKIRKKILKDPITLVLHPILWKHASTICAELNRSGRIATVSENKNCDTFVITKTTYQAKGTCYFVDVKPYATHYKQMSLAKTEYNKLIEEIKNTLPHDTKTIVCETTSIKTVCNTVLPSFIEGYGFTKCSADFAHYYIVVPLAAGFEDLTNLDIPFVRVTPMDCNTVKDLVTFANSTTCFDIIVTHQHASTLPKNWVLVGTVFIRDRSRTIKKINEHHLKVNHNRIMGVLDSMVKNNTGLAVKNVASLVNAISELAAASRKKIDDNWVLSKPTYKEITGRLSRQSEEDIETRFYACQMQTGDYIKMSVGNFTLSIYRNKLSDMTVKAKRNFLVFRQRQKHWYKNEKIELGQLECIGEVISIFTFKKNEFVHKCEIESSGNTMYITVHKETSMAPVDVDLLTKGVIASRLECVADGVNHIWVALPDDQGKKNVGMLMKLLTQEFSTHGIELTFLVGLNNTVASVAKHAHVALKALASGEEIKIDSSVNADKETRRKDLLNKSIKTKIDRIRTEPETCLEFSFQFIQEEDHTILCYYRGRVESPDWEVFNNESEFLGWINWYTKHVAVPRRQPWMYNMDTSSVVGLLPLNGYRPSHFGIHWPDTVFVGTDVVGHPGDPLMFGPKYGARDVGRKCSYKTEPIAAHSGGCVTAIYTTEIQGHIGEAYVFAKTRLMSGAEVFVYPRDVEMTMAYRSPYMSVGFITSCSAVKIADVDGYMHPLEAFDTLRMKTKLEYLNKNTRVALKPGKVAKILDETFNPYNLDLTTAGRIPNNPAIKSPLTSLVEDRQRTDLDPIYPINQIDIVDLETEAPMQWWEINKEVSFSKSDMDCSWLQTIPSKIDTGLPPYCTHGHVICPIDEYSAIDSPIVLRNDNVDWVASHSSAKDKMFCSIACAYNHNMVRYMIKMHIANFNMRSVYSEDFDINRVKPLYSFVPTALMHPCLPELERLTRALSTSNFNRVKWYDSILDRTDEEHVFLGFQVYNRKRFDKLNVETDALCSEGFDFPDTFNGSSCIPAQIEKRTILTTSPYRKSSIYVVCTTSDEDVWEGKPLIVRYSENKYFGPDDRAYVLLRRACCLLLAQGWNYIDVMWDEPQNYNLARTASALCFNMDLYGVHCINLVTQDPGIALRVRYSNQLMTRPGLCPPQLAVSAPFLWQRGAKTAVITESLQNWHQAPQGRWEQADVKRLGLTRIECPEITVSQDSRPDWMGDSMFSIWNISNGIKTGTCFASGYSVVGSNHCTLGNAICVESPVPHGTGISAMRAVYRNKISKSFTFGDIDMHNSPFTFASPRKGEIYAVLNPVQNRGRWLMCTGVNTFDEGSQTRFNRFVPVEVDHATDSVTVSPYKLYKGLSGSPIVNNKGAVVGVYGLSKNITYQDTSIDCAGVDTTLYHSMVTDNVTESETYFVEAAKQLCAMDAGEERFCFLEAPTGTGKSTLFPLAVIEQVSKSSKINTYSVCMLEPTRAAVHNCYDRIVSMLDKSGSQWKKIYCIRLSTGKRGELEGESFRTIGAGKISLNILTYGRFIADYRGSAVVPHNFDMLLMDEIHTRSKDPDVATSYLLSGDTRTEMVKVCYMTATAVGRVCDLKLCEGKDLSTTRFRITEEYLLETKKSAKKGDNAIVMDSSYFTIDIKAAKLNLSTRANYVSWPREAMKNGRCLVFLPSRSDCEKFVSWCKRTMPNEREKFVSLHAGSKVSDLTSLPEEAIIGCTDFASTAITVPNCKCVVDFLEDWSPVVSLFANDSGLVYRNTISKEVVSKQVSTQRKGRTGRTCDGTYFTCSSITPKEETKLSESMYAQIYFNLLIKMGKPKSLQAYILDNPDLDRVFEHDWLEPDNISMRWPEKHHMWKTEPMRTAFNRFCVKASEKLQAIREWDKDQLWWYLNPAVSQEYIDFCFSAENSSTHGFGIGNARVTQQLRELWCIVPTEDEADKVRNDMGFSIMSYEEDMRDFDNYVQRAHNKVGSIDLHTLSKRVKATAPAMYNKIALKNFDKSTDIEKHLAVEATDPAIDEEINHENGLGITLGAVTVACALGAVCSTGVFAYNHKSDWQALEVHFVDRSRLAGAIKNSMINLDNAKVCPPLKDEPVLKGIDYIIEYIKDRWSELSAFVQRLMASFYVNPGMEGANHENAADLLPVVLAGLAKLKLVIMGYYVRYGSANISSWVGSFFVGSIYNKMCDNFGIIFSNIIITMAMAACSTFTGPVHACVNGVIMIISYVLNTVFTSSDTFRGPSKAMRASALLLSTGGAVSLGLLLKGSVFYKAATVNSGLNVTNGVISMLNPYNTGVSRVSDGVIIAKMIANMCNKRCWTTSNCLASASTLMSMFFRADAMTVMVSMTAGIFLGFTRLYMSNTEFWFKMTSALGVKHADTYKELVQQNSERFDAVFETILGVAGVLANPMSLISIISNVMADTLVAYMQDPSAPIEFKTIVVDNSVFYSGVSMVYGLSCAIFKVCSQLRDCVGREFSMECAENGLMSVLRLLSSIWEGFSVASLLRDVKESLFKFFKGSKPVHENDSIITELINMVWLPVKGFVGGCYEWCKDAINTAWNRFENRISKMVSSILPFGQVSIDCGTSRGEGVSSADLLLTRCSSIYKKATNCSLSIDDIKQCMKGRRCCINSNQKPSATDQWMSGAGLIGWIIYNEDVDVPFLLVEALAFEGSAEDDVDISECWYIKFARNCLEAIKKKPRFNFEEFVLRSEGFFTLVGDVSTIGSAINALEDGWKDRGDVETQAGDSDAESTGTLEAPNPDNHDINMIIDQLTSKPWNFTWLEDMRLHGTDEDITAYNNCDPRFWLKHRMQETSDKNVIPLLVQSVNNVGDSFGNMPNIICDMKSSIFVKADLGWGSGDYVSGTVSRPWDVIRLDNIALCKLLSVVGPCQDYGTHVSLTMRMSDSSVIVMSVSHSYTDHVANTGLLCQVLDSKTKEVSYDLASVEIFSKSTVEGIEILGTCPPSTGGAWESLYTSILKYLPFFKDVKYKYITDIQKAKQFFDEWADEVVPTLDEHGLHAFENWRKEFSSIRFSGKGVFGTIKSSTTRYLSNLVARYNKSMQESKDINEFHNNPKNITAIKQYVRYKSYYKDYAAAAHNRRGDVCWKNEGLPDSIEDVRIHLTPYAVAAWFKGLIAIGFVDYIDTPDAKVESAAVSFKTCMHHPAVYLGANKYEDIVDMRSPTVAKAKLVRLAYIGGYNVIFANNYGGEINYEMAATAGLCRCTIVYMISGTTISSVAQYGCRMASCTGALNYWAIWAYDPENPKGWIGLQDPKNKFNHESDSWIPALGCETVFEAFELARDAVNRVIARTEPVKQVARAVKFVKDLNDKVNELDRAPVEPVYYSPVNRVNIVTSSNASVKYGSPIIDVKLAKERARISAINADKKSNMLASLNNVSMTPGVKRFFNMKKSMGDEFFDWIRDICLDEQMNKIEFRKKNLSNQEVAKLKSRYGWMTREELQGLYKSGMAKKDFEDYLALGYTKSVCSEAPWCDGWDKVAIRSRSSDIWLTDGNMNLYHPHDLDDERVIHDIIRVNRMADHVPKEIWEQCRYKGRMELPAREAEIGAIYASRAACKAQLLYEYLPSFWNDHKTFFEPCCGFGGFAQYFSHQMRNMASRQYLVSSMNRKGHAMPNWSLMQAANSNCRVIRTLDDVRDGNICDPKVLDAACGVIKDKKVTMLIFDIGERHLNPDLDDAWYLAPRNVRGGFDKEVNTWKYGINIVGAMQKMCDALSAGSSALFKINTFSKRTTDIIHILSSQFRKVRALKLATTPELSREWYLFCSNKVSDWEAPVERSILLKNCVRELTWNSIYRAENMYRTKGRHVSRPMSHKWFIPDTSGICYKSIPNEVSEDDSLPMANLPQGHSIDVVVDTPFGEVHVNEKFVPDWNRRFKCMKDYVNKVNRVAKDRTGKGRDSIRFDNVVRSDFEFVVGIGSYKTKSANVIEKHTANELISSYLNNAAGMNLTNATYGHTQGTPEYVKPALKKRLDVQPGQPDPTCVIDFIKAVHCLMSEACRSKLGKFSFATEAETYAMIVKTGSTGILDPGSNLKEFMELYPEWYELAWSHILNPHLKGEPTPSYQSVRIKPEPKGRKDAEDGRLQYPIGTELDKLKSGTSLSPRFIQFSDALTRIAHIIVFGKILEFHSHHKLYKGSINGTPPHITGRVMRSYWDLHNPISKRVVHVGNNKELDINIEPVAAEKYKPEHVDLVALDYQGRLGADTFEDKKSAIDYDGDLPAGLTIDFSALDSTVTVSERMVMASVWKQMFSTDRERKIVEGICRDMTYAICLDDAGDIWVRDGQRGSGEILTSIENTWLVCANIISAMSHGLGISIEDLTRTQGYVNVLTKPGGCGSPKVNVLREIQQGAKHKRFEFGEIPVLVDGDDVVIISTKRRINQLQDYMNGTFQWLACNRKVIRSGNKGGATMYTEFEGLSFCSHRYEAVFIGPNAAKYSPKFLPRADHGRLLKRGDILSVAEDNDFKIYFLPIRPVADILSKLMVTLKVKALKWDPTKTQDGECVDLTQSKIISYLLLYPQCRWVRYTCLTLLCVTGDNLATFAEFRKRYRELDMGGLKTSSMLLSSMHSLYGVSSLDDVSLREYRTDFAEIRKVYYNSKLTGHYCQTTRAKWLETSFNWLKRQHCTDVYPLMWDSSIFAHYKNWAEHNQDKKLSDLQCMLREHVRCTETTLINNQSSLWERILTFTG